MSRLGNAILDRAGERAASLPANLFSLFLDLLSVFVISLLLVTNRMRLRGFTLSLVGHEHRDRVAEVLDRSWARIGVYLRAKVIVMAIVGTLTYVALLVIGVPFAVPLAIVVAFGELIPRAGPWLARIPLLSIAALEGPRTFLLTLVASILIENLKGYVISPFVEGDQLDIHPLAVFVAVPSGRRSPVPPVRSWRCRRRRSSTSSSARSSSPGATTRSQTTTGLPGSAWAAPARAPPCAREPHGRPRNARGAAYAASGGCSGRVPNGARLPPTRKEVVRHERAHREARPEQLGPVRPVAAGDLDRERRHRDQVAEENGVLGPDFAIAAFHVRTATNAPGIVR